MLDLFRQHRAWVVALGFAAYPQTLRSLLVLGFKIAAGRRCDRIARLELLDDHVLLRVMAGIRIVLEVVDDREDDLVIRAFTAIKHTQLPFKHAKQAFDVAMFLT